MWYIAQAVIAIDVNTILAQTIAAIIRSGINGVSNQ
jgi:hypothetical protein